MWCGGSFQTSTPDLGLYFEETTERLIRAAIHADTTDADTAIEPTVRDNR